MTDRIAKVHRLALVVTLVLGAVTACVPGLPAGAERTDTPPTVKVISPTAGQVVTVNQPIKVTSQSEDPDGIQRVELWADGVLTRTDINPTQQSPYVVAQDWQSDRPGSHVFIVKAFDGRGKAGQSEPLVITVAEPPSPSPVAQTTPTLAIATPPPSPTATPPPPSPTSPPPPTATPLTPTATPVPVCTPPPCQADEVYYCPSACPGGCGTQCATPTPSPTRPTFRPTDFTVHEILKPVWDKPEVNQLIGFPTAAASADRQYARQYFERGYMYWWNRPDARGLIWVVQMPDGAAMSGIGWIGPFEDLWDGQDPISCEAANRTAYGPRSGFGRLWCDHPEIAQTIGAAREPERGTGESTDYGVVQMFQGGTMLYSPLDREVWVLANGGVWLRYFK